MTETNLSHRRATLDDLPSIIALLADDSLGKTRTPSTDNSIPEPYLTAFEKISQDPNQYLMVIEHDGDIVGTCHLTTLPSLTLNGTTRLQIEGVRISSQHRGKGFGNWMMTKAIEFAQKQDARLIQLTTDKRRNDAYKFYKDLGFTDSHEGMKLYL